MLASTTVGASTEWGWGWQRTEHDPWMVSVQSDSTSQADRLIGLYRQHVSPRQGGRCPCFPSCSVYTQYAISKYGLFVGFIMGIERMYLRENQDMRSRLHYGAITRAGVERIYDPPQANYIFGKKDWRMVSPRHFPDWIGSGSGSAD